MLCLLDHQEFLTSDLTEVVVQGTWKWVTQFLSGAHVRVRRDGIAFAHDAATGTNRLLACFLAFPTMQHLVAPRQFERRRGPLFHATYKSSETIVSCHLQVQ